MSNVIGTAAVVSRIKFLMDEYDKEAYKIMQWHAADAMAYFDQVQTAAGKEQKGMFWTNHTFRAANDFFAKAWQIPGSMGVTLANNRDYAVKLETEFEMRFASFPTMRARMEDRIRYDLQVLYGEV